MSTAGRMDSVWMVWRVSGWLRDLGMSQVSGFDFLHIVYLYRFDLDPATSTSPSIESNDSIQTFWIVLGWLHCASALQVSCFVPLHLFVIDVLGPEVYRFDLHPIASRPGSNSLIQTFRIICGWLRNFRASQVSNFSVLLLFVIQTLDLEPCRFDLHSIVLTLGSNDPIATFQNVCGWLHRSGVF